MNDDELKRKLREMAVPAPGEGAREKALHRARTAFANGGMEPVGKAVHGWLRLAVRGFACMGLAAALAGLLVARFHRPNTGTADLKVLNEMQTLFPGQVDSVVTNDGRVDLNLAEAPGENSLQPLAVVLRRGSQVIRVLTYSGRKVCLDLGGHKECFETLVTGEGQVILSGDHFVWSAGDAGPVDGYNVQAATL